MVRKQQEKQLNLFHIDSQENEHFLCGYCMWEQDKSLNERLAMSQRVNEGDNICHDCGFNVKKVFDEKGKMSINFSRRSKY